MLLAILSSAACTSEQQACDGADCAFVDDDSEGLEFLQIKGMKAETEDMEDMSSEEVAEEAKDVDEDEEEDADVDEDEEEDADDSASSSDAEEVVAADDLMALPMGKSYKKGYYCQRCYSPRGWLGKKTLQQCNDHCAKESPKKCKYFSFGRGQCSICSGTCRTKMIKGYNSYYKYEIEFPVRDANCAGNKRSFSEKGMGKARGCKKRAKKLGAVAFSYKKKKCRTWKKCESTKKAKGWVLNKVR